MYSFKTSKIGHFCTYNKKWLISRALGTSEIVTKKFNRHEASVLLESCEPITRFIEKTRHLHICSTYCHISH